MYNEHKVPEKTQKEASDTVHKIALATAEKTGKYGDENFQEYKQSVIAAAVEAASPKVAEIKHKANVKAMKELRDVKARARATVEVSKKQEEKQEEQTKPKNKGKAKRKLFLKLRPNASSICIGRSSKIESALADKKGRPQPGLVILKPKVHCTVNTNLKREWPGCKSARRRRRGKKEQRSHGKNTRT